ncbi:hypothetical protein J6590_036008 [Homalodisca vitripennis]|nr:hypothetical protein J6590_036008 [Homalodisca vitripennis]
MLNDRTEAPNKPSGHPIKVKEARARYLPSLPWRRSAARVSERAVRGHPVARRVPPRLPVALLIYKTFGTDHQRLLSLGRRAEAGANNCILGKFFNFKRHINLLEMVSEGVPASQDDSAGVERRVGVETQFELISRTLRSGVNPPAVSHYAGTVRLPIASLEVHRAHRLQHTTDQPVNHLRSH